MKRLSLLLLVISFSTLALGRSAPQDSSVNPGAPSTPIPVEKILSPFNAIPGTDYLMAALVSSDVGRDSSLNPFAWINSSYSGYPPYAAFNYVFFNTKTEEYRRLLPTNNFVIMSISVYPQQVYGPNNPDTPPPPVKFWIYRIVKADNNKDGYLDHRDKITVGISEISGSGYVELIENADAVLSQYYKDPSNFSIIYNVNGKNFIAKVNPITRVVVSTVEMDLGEDVK